MSKEPLPLTGNLARAARALVGVSAADAAEAAGLTRRQLRNFEKSLFPLTIDQRIELRSALERLGAHFVSDGNGGRGHGVRLKFSASKTERVESWEAEGGLAADDDV
ncbi:XRE family transcriptional regulator [Leucobacter denitrificans]|uniref:XRE family transcriptional regulator n=1 Tax=Leucobacter denitrificans TaxID=683042 RepID=A0A7G9S5K4_9MICO|nr:XRE family transcriptional regulator [Leucobacter denitrificans]QNN63129.1 XRE family transcriptional regulator [Leucobacter denitrificans]